MFKKYTALLFICISGIIYAGHSFIPHQHHHEHSEHGVQVLVEDHHEHEEAEHHHENHDDDHNDEKHHQNNSNEHSDLSDILAHFSHGESFFKIDEGYEIKIDFSKGESIPVLTSSVVKWAEPIPVPIRRICYHYKDPDYHSHSRIHFGLRAPPVVA